MKSKTIYFVAGEASADNYGAALMRSLQGFSTDLNFIGRGGPQMRTIAGRQFKDWIDEAAVLGLWEVIRKYSYFREQLQETLNEVKKSKPDAVVLIDYPGFNLRLARALRKQSPQSKIIYYVSPQVWACARKIDTERDSNLIGLFPGSRFREVRQIFPVMLQSVSEFQKRNPNMRFEVGAASEELAREMRGMLNQGVQDGRAIQVKVGETAALMQRALAGIVASGSATLEAAYFRLPFVLIYKVAWPTYLAARLVVNVKYLGMPNVLADKEVVSEFIQHRARPDGIVKAVRGLMKDADARDRMVSEFDRIVGKLGEGGASEKAARAIAEEIGRSRMKPVN